MKITLAYVPYLTLADRAVPPLGESKPEWEVFSLLAERVGAEARRRGLTEVQGHGGRRCNIARLGQRFSDNGRFGPDDDEKILRLILRISRPSQGISLEDLRDKGGAIRFRKVGDDDVGQGVHSEYRMDEPVVPMRDFVEKKKSYPTLTGRQQFYIDAPWLLEVGEELPVHKEPPSAGGNYPFTLTCGHTRWSIHSIWRDQELMLQLQRGEPVVHLNQSDALQAGISDHDAVRIWNDVGEFVGRAKLTGAMRPNQAYIDHAWEPYQFRGGKSDQHVRPSPIKVTQLVGDYGHVHWGPGYYEPNQTDRDTRVNVTKL
jgi:nitrate reductase alpha subunit